MNYTFSGRYTDELKSLLNELGATQELRVEFEDDYTGKVDLDVLLKDGRVFSYLYYYGSCSGCDDWQDRNLSENEIKNEMRTEATFFNSVEDYKEYVKRKALPETPE